MPIGPARMPLFDHLGELRMRLVRIVACLAVAVVVFYMATPTIGQFLLMPIAEFLPTDANGFVQTIAIDPFEAFSTRFKICYLIILNPAFQWLTDQAMGLGDALPRMSSYIDTIIKFELAFGFAFELPLVIFYLVIFDVVPYKKLRGSWRVVYVVLMVVSAMATPDASPVTMLLMFAAMIALYEGSLLIARVVLGRRIKRQNERLAAEEDE